ncbi:hypothetical protein BDR03DRAFT_960761, partial [Suillus americanus]
MTRCDSATSMSITDALALSPTNRLTPYRTKGHDHKAGKVLGDCPVTLTWDRYTMIGNFLYACRECPII